jgi:hypothetical protein
MKINSGVLEFLHDETNRHFLHHLIANVPPWRKPSSIQDENNMLSELLRKNPSSLFMLLGWSLITITSPYFKCQLLHTYLPKFKPLCSS